VGLAFAKALGLSLQVPVIPVHHILAHVFSFLLCDNRPVDPYPALCLVVSGGHTLLVAVESETTVQVIASTRDDAAGEAFDKIASLLGLPYPGGPSLSVRAERGDPFRYPLPKVMVKDPASFSFSGLKTACARLAATIDLLDEQVVSDMAASAEAAIVRTLVEKTSLAVDALKPKTLLVTGGVAANRRLRESILVLGEEKGLPTLLVPHRWCTDNAAMIAVVASLSLGRSVPWGWNPRVQSEFAPGVRLDVGPLPRWPLEASMLPRDEGPGRA
jgi:N6-L-threonylcarbamoyladenine synthase